MMSNEDNTKLNAVSEQPTTTDQQPDRELLSWSTHPAKARPQVAAVVGIFLVVLTWLVYYSTASWFFVAVAALVLWGSLSQFFVPTKFTFTERKVKVRYIVNKIEKEWSQYRSFYIDKNGVLLSPFVRPSRLENFRGLYVRFANNRDEVIAIVKDKIIVPEDDLE
jgi:hypothetical protein